MRNAKLVAAVASLAAAGLGAVSLAVGCSSSSSGGTTGGTIEGGAGDAGTGEDCGKIDSACGQPCDPGNSLGVGKFCNNLTDCKGTAISTLCATLGAPSEHFCTTPCSAADAGAEAGFRTDCGENATCQCQGGQCGCVPSSCF